MMIEETMTNNNAVVDEAPESNSEINIIPEKGGITKEAALVAAGIAVAGAVAYKVGETAWRKAIKPACKKVGSGVKKLFTKKEKIKETENTAAKADNSENTNTEEKEA